MIKYIEYTDIKRPPTGSFRQALRVEDLKELCIDTFTWVPNVETVNIEFADRVESMLVFLDTGFNKVNTYELKLLQVAKLTDPRIKVIIKDMLWMNPGIDDVGLKNLTSYIIRVILSPKSTITYEQLRPLVDRFNDSLQGYSPHSSGHIMFSRDCQLTGDERRDLSRKARLSAIRGKLDSVAALLAQDLAETYKTLILTPANIVNYSKTLPSGSKAVTPYAKLTPRNFNAVTSESTKRDIALTNSQPNRVVKQISTADKSDKAYKLLLEGDKSMREINRVTGLDREIIAKLKKAL